MVYLAQHYAEAAVAHDPDRTAIRCPEAGMISYGKLEARANQIAHALIDAGVTRQDRVMICHRRTADFVAAILAVLKADAIYVPLPESSPPGRSRRILEDCRPRALICDAIGKSRLGPVLDELRVPPVEVMLGTATLAGVPDHRPPSVNIDADLAYILYTSGSSGSPKGVMVTHANLTDYVAWAVGYFGLRASDRVLNAAPFYFDMSTFDVYSAQAAGASLSIAPAEELLFPARLVQRIERDGITVWKAVSSLLTYIVTIGALARDPLRSLQRLAFAGETFPTKHLAEWMRTLPDCTFYNAYGPTEATGIAACHRVERVPGMDELLPIGTACANAEILVVREDGSPAGVGERGELWIRGACVSAGYWNDPAGTDGAFVARRGSLAAYDRMYRTGDIGYADADGVLHLVGRRDDQVKYHGYRIDLGEIVSAVQSLPDVRDAAVLLLSHPRTRTAELVAFVDAASGHQVPSLRTSLQRMLPACMIPSRCIARSPLPRTDRGKLDRLALERAYHEAVTP